MHTLGPLLFKILIDPSAHARPSVIIAFRGAARARAPDRVHIYISSGWRLKGAGLN